MKKATVKVLIVDDEFDLAEALSYSLQSANVKVDISLSAEDALEKIANESFNIVLSDLRMPSMSGLELLQRINQSENNDIAVFLMTGFADHKDINVLAEGAKGLFKKPEEISQMTKAIGNYIKTLQAE